uniref:Peptidase S1 domain-containing protein n=1 Tax=Plectus sambesii TaxID=2011161 RepID=A0A914XTU7_9BILA
MIEPEEECVKVSVTREQFFFAQTVSVGGQDGSSPAKGLLRRRALTRRADTLVKPAFVFVFAAGDNTLNVHSLPRVPTRRRLILFPRGRDCIGRNASDYLRLDDDAMGDGLRLVVVSATTWLSIVVLAARECGVDNNAARAHVLGGYPVAQNGFPWVISIRLRSSGVHICAGTLISDQFVLTAGHCMYKSNGVKRRPSDFFIVVGAHRLNLRGLEESWLFAREIHIHPSYRSPLVRKWSHDLAIVELRSEHPYLKSGRPACLPTSQAPIPNERCIVLGWGQTETSRYSNVLQIAVAPIVRTDICNAAQYWDRYVDETMMCAGIVRSINRDGSGACQGDSGGPLLCQKGAFNQWTLYGIVSWGPVLCGEKPGVYTNLVEFGDWIRAVIRKNGGHLYEVRDGSWKSEFLPRKLTPFHNHTSSHESSTPPPPCDGSKPP